MPYRFEELQAQLDALSDEVEDVTRKLNELLNLVGDSAKTQREKTRKTGE